MEGLFRASARPAKYLCVKESPSELWWFAIMTVALGDSNTRIDPVLFYFVQIHLTSIAGHNGHNKNQMYPATVKKLDDRAKFTKQPFSHTGHQQ